MIQDPNRIIQTIRLSEKATRLGDENNEYVFLVNRAANKLQIKAAVEQHFGKKVAAVRTATFDGKARRQSRADAGRTNHYKKAIVRLKDGGDDVVQQRALVGVAAGRLGRHLLHKRDTAGAVDDALCGRAADDG